MKHNKENNNNNDMAFILYDRYFSLDERTGTLKTFWRVIGNKYNSIVQLHETYPVQTLNCFNKNISSLYIFCKLTQCTEFEKCQLVDLEKQYGNYIKIFKYQKKLTIALTSSTLVKNYDKIQNIFMMYTHSDSNLDIIENKETISYRIVYKISFKNEDKRNEIVSRMNLFAHTSYPDIEMFIPFDDECELFLNHIFPTNRNWDDNNKYTYMTLIPTHLMDFVKIIESFHGIIQFINSRNISQNVLMVESREAMKNPKTITDFFLSNVPIIDIFIGRVYENETCIEFHHFENEITFIMIKVYIYKRTQYIVFVNAKYQRIPLEKNSKINNIIVCENECHLLNTFYNLYSNGFIFKVMNMDIHFIIVTQRYNSNSYILLYRIIYNNLWMKFAPHCVVSEDGRCIQFNRNSIILFDNIEKLDEFITNYKHIDLDVVYLPELYNDSMLNEHSPIISNHILNIRPEKISKYVDLQELVINNGKRIKEMSVMDMILKIYNDEENNKNQYNYNLILESIIELSNKVRIPITSLYSLSLAQIAYRLIFYTNLRNGIFLIMDRDDKSPCFYQTMNPNTYKGILQNLKIPQELKVFQNIYINDNHQTNSMDNQLMFQNVIKKYIPIIMTGNLIENYLNLFCPDHNYLPILSTLVENESQILSFKNSILWSRQQLFHTNCIVSFDFSLYNSSILATFGLDFQNCGIFYGFELKSFFLNIFPTENIFNKKNLQFLQLPYTFIMDNDTLEIINVKKYNDINRFGNDSVYIVIMRFITTHVMQQIDKNYHTLGDLFYKNIIDMRKYKTRLVMHKNILNSVAGMLSTYQINTVLLNIINALSRKIILWVVSNCIQANSEKTTSFIDHKYNNIPPNNLISIENDSFTFIYKYENLNYENFLDEEQHIEEFRCKILQQLCSELEKCLLLSKKEISQIFNLKVNFITGNLFQISTRKFFYISKELMIVSNEKNNKTLQKSLKYLNMKRKLIEKMKNNEPINLLYLRKTHDFTETRNLLIWYMMQHSRNQNEQSRINNDQITIFNILRLLNEFTDKDEYDKREILININILFNLVRETHIERYFLNILSSPLCNIFFKQVTIPQNNAFDSVQLPSDKKTLIFNCIQIFFKINQKNCTLHESK